MQVLYADAVHIALFKAERSFEKALLEIGLLVSLSPKPMSDGLITWGGRAVDVNLKFLILSERHMLAAVPD